VALAAVLAFAVPPVAGRLADPPADPSTGRPERLVRCDATRLALPDGMADVQAEAVDPTGRYIVGSAVASRGGDGLSYRPVLWTDGQPRLMGTIGASVRASDVDPRGTVVAVGGDSDMNGRWDSVIRYAGGVPEKLVPPPGDWTFAATPRIDEHGDVRAVAYRASEPRDPVVLIWAAGSATATRLERPAGSTVAAATDAGTVVADVASRWSRTVSISVWDRRGPRRDLAEPAGAGFNFVARGDWVAANVGSGTVVRWSLRTGEMTDTGVNASVIAVNALGWVLAGQSLRRDDAIAELAAPGGLTGTPEDVSDTGLVVGTVYDQVEAGATPAVSAGAPGSPIAGPVAWNCRIN
jgi:hypothetical protein